LFNHLIKRHISELVFFFVKYKTKVLLECLDGKFMKGNKNIIEKLFGRKKLMESIFLEGS